VVLERLRRSGKLTRGTSFHYLLIEVNQNRCFASCSTWLAKVITGAEEVVGCRNVVVEN